MVSFLIESWIWWSIGVSIAIARLAARILHLGQLKKLQLDDYLMMLAVCSHTAFIVTINKEVNYNSNLIEPGTDVYTLSQSDIDERVYGSKLTVVVEQMQCLTTWTLKLCLICLYWRVTHGFKTHLAVKALAIYVVCNYILMEILYLFVWCRPFHQYWQVIPLPNIQCSAAINHLITNAVFNISSDIWMMGIAFSLFLGNHLPLSRKIALCGIFGLGLFTILSAILNKYYSFTHPFGSEWTYWYVRESSTALIVANLPFTWAILRRLCGVRAFNPTVSDNGNHKNHTLNTTASFNSNLASQLGSPTRMPDSPGRVGNSEDTIFTNNSPTMTTVPSNQSTQQQSNWVFGNKKQGSSEVENMRYALPPEPRKNSHWPDWKKAGITGQQDLELLQLEEGFGEGPVAFDFGFPTRHDGHRYGHQHHGSRNSSVFTGGIPLETMEEDKPVLGQAISTDGSSKVAASSKSDDKTVTGSEKGSTEMQESEFDEGEAKEKDLEMGKL